MLGLTLFGGMLLSVLPHEAGISWQSHLGGAIGGVVGGLWGRHADPMPPRVRYSWEDEDDATDDAPVDTPRDAPQPRVTFYVATTDIEKSLHNVCELGGGVLMPRTELPGGTIIGKVADPEGNPIGLVEEQAD
jgi:predicted enzyme related to lactoylglutathione lyase